MKSPIDRKNVRVIMLIVGILLGLILFQLFKTFNATKNQLSSGEDLVLFNGLDVFFYLFLAFWGTVDVLLVPRFALHKPLFFVFLLGSIALYEANYDAISMRYVDSVAGKNTYSLCMQKRKEPKGGFGNNYVLARNPQTCDRLAPILSSARNSHDIEIAVQNLKAEKR